MIDFEIGRELAEKYNLPVAFNNQYFRYVNRVISADQLGVLGIFIGLVFIGSYTVIKSIFQISIINNIRNYGQLRTIGATQKQVKNVVRRVVHPTFGEGVVIKSDGKKLTIAFKTVGIKTIIENFVKFVE